MSVFVRMNKISCRNGMQAMVAKYVVQVHYLGRCISKIYTKKTVVCWLLRSALLYLLLCFFFFFSLPEFVSLTSLFCFDNLLQYVSSVAIICMSLTITSVNKSERVKDDKDT